MKKILSLTLAVMMLVSVVPMVYAADVDYTNGTAVEYTATGTEAYTVTVPAELAPGASGTVTLEGTWASDRKVTVSADANVVLTNSINAADTKTLDVTFAGIEKAGNNTEAKTYTETVSVAAMPADALFGTWSGKFNYNVELVEETAEIITFASDGNTLHAEKGMTWAEWIESDYNTSTNFTIGSNNIVRCYDIMVRNEGNGQYVHDTDEIISGGAYSTTYNEV